MLFSIFTKIVRLLAARGLGLSRFPLVMKVYKFLYYSLLPQKSIILVPVQEHKMYVDIGDIGDVTLALRFSGIYHPQMTKVFRNSITQGMVCIDIGANIGYFTLIAARLVGEDGKVFAFEPEPHNFDLLTKNITLNEYDNVIPVQKAISNKNKKAKLFVDRTLFSCHSLSGPRPSDSFHSFGHDIIEVETQTLDSFFKDYTGRVDFVKIDVEGARISGS